MFPPLFGARSGCARYGILRRRRLPQRTVASDDFGFTVATSNTTAVAGVPGFSKAAGRAYVFTNTATGWKQAVKLKAPTLPPLWAV